MAIPPTYVWKTLYGERIFMPKTYEPNSCGIAETNAGNRNILDGFREDPLLELDDRMLRLQFAVDGIFKSREEEIDRASVNEASLEIYPCHKAPQQRASVLYERDKVEKAEQKEWMLSRIKMFELAYETRGIFTISISPKNPQICQSWYQKRSLKASSEHYLPDSYSYEDKTKVCSMPATETDNPEVQMGFLKPYEAFTSCSYAPDPIFGRIEAAWIGSVNDITGSLSDVTDGALNDRLVTILTHFLIDDQADSIGLRFHSNGQGFIKLFRKSVI